MVEHLRILKKRCLRGAVNMKKLKKVCGYHIKGLSAFNNFLKLTTPH